mmetsp:Transcript_5243/g.5699  ORF Transcript_5243/g.5699 Transcript_5243/m.5699 type:complete len:251 (+) Transcript_5243:59-811(+)
MSKPQIVRFKSGKTVFEILTKPGSVLQYREKKITIKDVLVDATIWKNASKAERASEDELSASFGTTDSTKVAETIVDKGTLQVSAKERKEAMDKKKKEIVNYIHKYYLDPKTKAPHPVSRIESALSSVKKFSIDPDAPTDRQVQDLAKALVGILAIKKAEMQATISVKHAAVGQVSGIVHQYCTVNKENYTASGCEWSVTLVPGDYESLNSMLVKVTKGDYSFDVVGQEKLKEVAPKQRGGRKGKKRGKR